MVYLIHFEQKFKHAQHYIGFTINEKRFKQRIRHHRNGSGSRLLKAVNEAGIKWEVVKTWPDADGNFERLLKNQKCASKHCPACSGNKTRKTRVPLPNQTNLNEQSNPQASQQFQDIGY